MVPLLSSTRSSLVWQYAKTWTNPNYTTCNPCDNKRISTTNCSTLTLSQHLILKHGQYELSTYEKDNSSSSPSFDINQKKKLHELIVNCVIHDSRTFSDFEIPGLRKLLKKRHTRVKQVKITHELRMS